jgi:DNA-binding GntR family transcriptional regulator
MMAEIEKQNANVLNSNQIRKAKAKNPFAKISDVVYDVLVEAILSSAISPGSKLNIAYIAERLGVSRTPVLNAIEQLKERGLVIEVCESSKYRNYYVFDISNDSLSDLFVVRKAMESSCSATCASKVGLINLDNIKKLANDFNNIWKEYVNNIGSAPSASKLAEIDIEFHYLLVLSTGNKYLIEIFNLHKDIMRYSSIRTCNHIATEKDKNNLLMIESQHISIYRAIESGLPELASKAMGVHIDFCHQRCLMVR